ncbi:MAG: succinylglutamate desuccinylase/aspartoacylase family protein [Sphingomonadaceae bacterium]
MPVSHQGLKVAGHDSFSIAGSVIAPGNAGDVSIPMSELAIGLPATLALRIFHGAEKGPTIFISAAIHGDEIVGTAIILRLLQVLDPTQLRGTIIFAPAVNFYGFLQHSRYLPDRRDLNRSFPGNVKGSLAGQLAHCFMTEVIDRCSLGIDIHSAAIHRYNLPQIRIAQDIPELLDLALVFGAPVVIESPLREGSMRALAKERGVDMLLMETGEALRFDRVSIEAGVIGVLRVLAKIGMIDASPEWPEAPDPVRTNSSMWVRAPRGGVSQRLLQSGDVVEKGDLLATVGGLFGEDPIDVESPIKGIIIGHATLPVVNQGDALFHIARTSDLEHASEQVETMTDAIDVGEAPFAPSPMLDEDEVI